jgi:hypothetical protein
MIFTLVEFARGYSPDGGTHLLYEGEVACVEKNEKCTRLKVNFLLDSNLPSIWSFSNVLTFYGGKFKIKGLLTCLSKGGGEFYLSKVKHGKYFQETIVDSCHVRINDWENLSRLLGGRFTN